MAAMDARRLHPRPGVTPPRFPLPQVMWQGKRPHEPRHCRDCGGKFSSRGSICPFCLSEHLEPAAARAPARG
jgi:predicted amidophosphoribosyltransferase